MPYPNWIKCALCGHEYYYTSSHTCESAQAAGTPAALPDEVAPKFNLLQVAKGIDIDEYIGG